MSFYIEYIFGSVSTFLKQYVLSEYIMYSLYFNGNLIFPSVMFLWEWTRRLSPIWQKYHSDVLRNPLVSVYWWNVVANYITTKTDAITIYYSAIATTQLQCIPNISPGLYIVPFRKATYRTFHISSLSLTARILYCLF